jgi:hypothetical protein
MRGSDVASLPSSHHLPISPSPDPLPVRSRGFQVTDHPLADLKPE